jgi:hypothetical protein
MKHRLRARKGNRSWRWSLMNSIHSQTYMIMKIVKRFKVLRRALFFSKR